MPIEVAEAEPAASSASETVCVPLEDIDLFVNQSREHFDAAELQALADNMTINGQLQPGVAWLDPGRNRLVLVCGERRYRALKLAGLPTMTVSVIRGHLTQGQMLQMNLAENIQRSSLNPIERAKGFQRLMQLEDLNASEVAARMNVSNATVSNTLALLNLPESLQAKVAAGTLPASVAAHIARTADEDTRRSLAEQFEAGVLTRAGVAAAVSKSARGKGKPARPKDRQLAIAIDGVSFRLSAKSPLQWESVVKAAERLYREAERLHREARPLADLARVLKAS